MIKTIGLLILSNIFMTLAWYGHLKFKSATLLMAILLSWLMALPEYMLQVPANRIGFLKEGLSGYQLKIIQECITLVVFIVFAWFVLDEKPQIKHLISFIFIIGAVISTFKPW